MKCNNSSFLNYELRLREISLICEKLSFGENALLLIRQQSFKMHPHTIDQKYIMYFPNQHLS